MSFRTVVGASFVALLCTIPVLFLPPTGELDAVRLLLAGFIATVAFVVVRASGASTLRSATYAALSLVVGLAIAIAKNVLSGH